MTYYVVMFDGKANHLYSGSRKTAERGAEKLAGDKWFIYCADMVMRDKTPLDFERWRAQHRIEIAPVTLQDDAKTA